MSGAPQLSWRSALRIAWREMRAARAKFLFVILSVAIGVGSLTGVRSFSRAFSRTLLREARTLMAGDLSVRIFNMPTPRQDAILADLERQGVRRTWITETVTMASSPAAPDPLLVSIKAVDPREYPYYGEVQLDPPQPLSRALDPQSVAVSDDLLLRLNVKVGGAVRIGGQDFRVAGVVVSEPDRMTGSLNVGPRLMMTRNGLARTGLMGLGSRASQRFLFKLPPPGEKDVERVRGVLKSAFPDSTVADFRETHPIVTRGLSRATTFLSLIGLIALVIGAMGVASAMHGHLRQKMDSIAVMKCLGARSSQVIRIYMAQTLMLGLGGGVAGVALGSAVSGVFPSLISRYFPIQAQFQFDPWPALQGLGIAVLVTLLFTLPPLISIRSVRPAQIFRRDMENPAARRWTGQDIRPAALLGGVILLGVGLVAATLTDGNLRQSAQTGSYFALALAVGVAALSLAAWFLLRGLRAFLRVARGRLSPVTRQGIANLYRPGSQASAAVVALGVGVMFTLAVFLIQSSVIGQLRTSAPKGMPNVFLLDIPGPDKQAVADLANAQPGIESPLVVTAAVTASMVAVNGTPVEKIALNERGHRFRSTRSVTWFEKKPEETEILAGAWWKPGDRDTQVCLSEQTAAMLNVAPGAVIDWSVFGRPLRSRLACIHRTESVRMAGHFEVIFNPGQLETFPGIYYGALRARPSEVHTLQREMYRRYPTVTVVNVADVLVIVQDVVDRIALVIRFISAFTVLAGVVMVASSVAGARFRRMREVVILKTLGATRRRIAGMFTIEFLALGGVAGLMGGFLAAGFTALLLNRTLEIPFRFQPIPIAATVLVTALVAAAAGWAASFRILGQKPLEILRDE